MNTRAYGNEGEQAACEFLQKKGYAILERNLRRGRMEIDIIARKRGVTAFIEVKRRRGTGFGRPAEAVNAQKQRHILQAAALYMQEKGMEDAPVRFDVIELLPGEIRHIESAFDATDLFD